MAEKGLVASLLEAKGLSKRDADMRKVPMSCKTTIEEDGEEREETAEFAAELPFSLADAILNDGEAEVFMTYLRAQAVYLQGVKRSELRAKGGAKPRGKAKYLEELGL